MVAPNQSNPSAFASASFTTPTAEAAGAAGAAGTASAGPRPVSARKRRANRRNAQKSTGPRTPQGKATSSRNAITHGIFCRDLLLKGEYPDLFLITRDGFLDALKPQDAAQLALVAACAICTR